MIKEKRKIQKISGSYYLNLPKNWVKNRKIAENSELEIMIVNDGSLKIAPEIEFLPEIPDAEVILPAERYVARQIIRKCLTGATKITVQSSEPIQDDIKKEIYKFVCKLPSAEIIDEDEHHIIVQNFKYNSIPTKQAIKRMFQLTHKIFEDLLQGVSTEIEGYLKEIDRFFIIIVIRIRHYLTHEIYSGAESEQEFTPIVALDFRMAIENIQRISKIIELIKNLLGSTPLPSELKIFGEKANASFKEAMSCFLESNSVQACLVWERYYHLQQEANNLLKEVQDENTHLIIYNFLRIADYAKRISDLVP